MRGRGEEGVVEGRKGFETETRVVDEDLFEKVHKGIVVCRRVSHLFLPLLIRPLQHRLQTQRRLHLFFFPIFLSVFFLCGC